MKYEIIKQIHNGLSTVIKIKDKYYEVNTAKLNAEVNKSKKQIP